jgi:hypothetical protein
MLGKSVCQWQEPDVGLARDLPSLSLQPVRRARAPMFVWA